MNYIDTYNPLYGRIINVRTESLKKKKKNRIETAVERTRQTVFGHFRKRCYVEYFSRMQGLFLLKFFAWVGYVIYVKITPVFF